MMVNLVKEEEKLFLIKGIFNIKLIFKMGYYNKLIDVYIKKI